jgi:hypothetical protein
MSTSVKTENPQLADYGNKDTLLTLYNTIKLSSIADWHFTVFIAALYSEFRDIFNVPWQHFFWLGGYE